jgi:hypothetical protein
LGQERGFLGQLGLGDGRAAVELGQALPQLGLEQGRLALEMRLGLGDEAAHGGEVDPELPARLLAFAAPEDEDVVEGPGERSLEEGRLFRPEGPAADLDELGHAQQAVEGDLEAAARPPRHPVEGGQDLFEQAFVEREIPALRAEGDEIEVDLDPAAPDPLLAEGPEAALGLSDRSALVRPVEEPVVEGLDAELQTQSGRGEASFGESGHPQDHDASSSLLSASSRAQDQAPPTRARAIP